MQLLNEIAREVSKSESNEISREMSSQLSKQLSKQDSIEIPIDRELTGRINSKFTEEIEELLKNNPSLLDNIKLSWKLRQQNFPNTITFDYPEGTPAISLTGTDCDLNCSHCGGHYLKGMLDKEQAFKKISTKPTPSCLITGGCNHHGSVDTTMDIAWIENMKQKLTGGRKINMHVGLIEGEALERIAEVADVVSFDIVGDDETIQEVYHIHNRATDYESCYAALRKKVRVIPHICIGLRGGELGHEYKALEMLERHGADAIVLIVFIPTKGTLYADRKPPDLIETIQFICKTRQLFPNTPISLGCMRPKGAYRAKLDYLTILSGVNRIVIPSSPARALVDRMGMEILRSQECCVL